jgi:DNA repair protein SbcD/Mre11
MGCRFVHTADVPFDSPRALRDPELADVIGGATREAFAAAIE